MKLSEYCRQALAELDAGRAEEYVDIVHTQRKKMDGADAQRAQEMHLRHLVDLAMLAYSEQVAHNRRMYILELVKIEDAAKRQEALDGAAG